MSFYLVWKSYFLHYVAYVCIVYIDMSKSHWKTIYCDTVKNPIEETGQFTWAMFGQLDTPINHS